MGSDADLVEAYVDGGRRDALAAIYDRHATALYDTAVAMTRHPADAQDLTHDVFVMAAERMHQLRDRHKLRPWLFSILRHAVYARSRARARTTPIDPTITDAMSSRNTIPSGASEPTNELDDRLASQDLAADVRAAARGLDQRDQFVLELVARQDLSGDELAEALGVSVSQSYVVVSRMRDRVERSLGAYAVARAGRRRCDELDLLLERWDGEFSVLIRKRVARHIDRCTTCSDTKRRTSAVSMVALAPAALLPATLRQRVLADVAHTPGAGVDSSPDAEMAASEAVKPGEPGGSVTAATPAAPTAPVAPIAPRRRATLRRQALGVAAASTLVIAGAVALARRDERPELAGSAAPATAPPSRVTATTVVTARPTTTTSVISVTTVDRPPTTAGSVVVAGPDTTAPGPSTTAGGIPAGPNVIVIVPADRQPPTVRILAPAGIVACDDLDPLVVEAVVADESGLDEVRVDWSGPDTPGTATMSEHQPGRWRAEPRLGPANGAWTVVVTAIDGAGNAGSATRLIDVIDCP
ncbi:MAG: sigma-70 family RNA polymerase sigma factor [Desertimonas sp.]